MRRPAPGKRPTYSLDEAALVRRLAGALPHALASGRARAAEWLANIARTASGKALKALIEQHPALTNLLDGIAEAAPYLWDLVGDDPARLLRLLSRNPEEEFAALLGKTRSAAAAVRGSAELMRVLRHLKAEAALLVALADIGGVWPVMRVTTALTEFAETVLGVAVRHLLGEAARRGKLRPPDPQNPEPGSGYIVLAMGKLGGRELNFSSDIDLMVFFDAAAATLGPDIEVAQLFVRMTRDLVRLLQERTADGYVFRVDLRLRPDPASTQIAISTEAALYYYESRGQNWERAAFIKARPCAGDLAAGERLIRDLSPFIWRKYLDYAAVADVHAMKQQIHAYRGHGEIAVEGHNIKLGRGGIREIEFFVQTQQLIAGGRHRGLRGRSTVATLAALAADGWIDAVARDELTAAYDFLRRVEHRLQMVADEQTHTLPSDRDALGEYARFLGFEDRDDFANVLLAHLRKVETHYVRLFERAPALLAQQQNLSFTTSEGESETLDRLSEMGFRQPREVAAAVHRWHTPTYRALRGEQARANLIELVPVIIDQFSSAENPDAAFAAFDQFLSGLRAGGRLLSLLRQNPELIRFIALILGVAPRLADILAQNPHVIDPLIDPSFFGTLPEVVRLERELAGALGEASGYEDVLDAIRLFGQEHMFLIGARILSGSVSAEQAGDVFAGLADVLICALHNRVEADFAAVHGRVRGQETAILALGRLGAREMTASSDLDLIVVYDFDEKHPNSDGMRPLYGAQYFARLTQRLISALTVQTNYGVLYQVDMRLRPSGRSGPLATHIDGFIGYQEREAWTWEHMALTRARVVSGSPAFAARVEAAIRNVLCRKRDARAVAADVIEMRAAIAKEKGDADPWDLKYAAGALVDIEFVAQYLQLVHAAAAPDILDTSTARMLEKAARLGVLAAEDAAALRPAVLLFHDLTQILRLCLPGAFEPKTANAGVIGLLARAADLPDFPALQAHVVETLRQVRECFVRVLGRAR
ncbi:MAG TPA: bifunctional [glutamine synthetase] adenylyltransferase/[glutamine synthetase]-adenylyl-L-tyrosine phosphorylase [Xanthobacteraceae bacterium]|nr:bifunctional [glutamine synthetase] adenylyltransferase/[glutamine synthetase]-adenylyl-L-tyrosine phosphorylase [Xanthobacteraceae bacterium]